MQTKESNLIQSVPAPTNKDEVRRFLEVVTYLSRFSEDLSTKSEPLRTLFIWEQNEQKAFEEIKALISTVPLLNYFDPAETVEVQVDAYLIPRIRSLSYARWSAYTVRLKNTHRNCKTLQPNRERDA